MGEKISRQLTEIQILKNHSGTMKMQMLKGKNTFELVVVRFINK